MSGETVPQIVLSAEAIPHHRHVGGLEVIPVPVCELVHPRSVTAAETVEYSRGWGWRRGRDIARCLVMMLRSSVTTRLLPSSWLRLCLHGGLADREGLVSVLGPVESLDGSLGRGAGGGRQVRGAVSRAAGAGEVSAAACVDITALDI